MQEKSSPLEKLDYLLELLKRYSSSHSYNDIWIKSKGKISDVELPYMLAKIIKDGYVIETKNSDGNNYSYSISFEGVIFQGYVSLNKLHRRAAFRNRVETLILTYGTFLAGLYGLFEISKWLFHHEGWHLLF